MENDLTQQEVQTLISLWLGHIRKLEASGDYPEKHEDKITLRKLTDLHFVLTKKQIKSPVKI